MRVVLLSLIFLFPSPSSPFHDLYTKQKQFPLPQGVTKGSLRDLERQDEKFERWLKSTIPEPFKPHYVPKSESTGNPNFMDKTKSHRSRKRRTHPTYPNTETLHILSKNITTILNSLLKNYDKKVRPNYGLEPVEVGVTMYVLSISSISEVLMDFTLDFYFRQMWTDPRLKFEGTEGISTLSVSTEFLESIWVPDTFFVNEKTSYFHTATTSNEFIRISKDGDITRSIRLTVTACCNMDLRHFPMDSQLCNIEIESYGYGMADIKYKWARGANSVGVSSEVSLPQFKVVGYRQKVQDIYLLTGNYSRLACEIQFVRSMGYYLIQVYIPSSLIVIMSWVSFWLNRNASPARVPLGITTVLTMTTLMSSVNKELPKISYVKSIDIFLGTCFVMVFAALLEYATVGYLAKRIQMRKNHFQALQKMAQEIQKQNEEQRKKEEEADEAIRLFHMQQQKAAHHHHHHYSHGHGHGQSGSGVRPMSSLSSYNAMQSPYTGHHHHQAQLKNASSTMLYEPGPERMGTYHRRGECDRYERIERGERGERDYSTIRERQYAPKEKTLKDEDAQLLEHTLRKIRIQVNSNQICGIAPSDIDKYSRVIFPVCFVCFHMFYWIVYTHISTVDMGDLVLITPET